MAEKPGSRAGWRGEREGPTGNAKEPEARVGAAQVAHDAANRICDGAHGFLFVVG